MKRKVSHCLGGLLLATIFEIVSAAALISEIPGVSKYVALLGFLAVVAFILEIVFCAKLASVNSKYKFALFCLIMAIITSLATVLIPLFFKDGLPKWADITTSITSCAVTIFEIFITFFIISGTIDVLTDNKKIEAAAFASKTLYVYFLCYIIIAIVKILLCIDKIREIEALSIALVIVSVVTAIAALLYYIVFLAKSRKALR